jgi:hypothetical protein
MLCYVSGREGGLHRRFELAKCFKYERNNIDISVIREEATVFTTSEN